MAVASADLEIALTKEVISYPENTRTAVERFCSVTRNSSIPRVNALRTAKVHAPPRLYLAALKFGLVLALELDMDRSPKRAHPPTRRATPSCFWQLDLAPLWPFHSAPPTSYESFCSNLQMSEQRDSGLSREGAPREGRHLSPFLGTINVEARPPIPTKLSSSAVPPAFFESETTPFRSR